MSNNPFQFPYGLPSNTLLQSPISTVQQQTYQNTVTQNSLLQNPFLAVQQQIQPTLKLTQIDQFEMVQSFRDSTNVTWTLVKKSFDSTVDIPDPKTMQIIGYWNHAFPGTKERIYIYVVEGIRQPRVETEKPTLIMYQWFSSVFVQNFTPDMITPSEWLKANVYAAPILDARVSKLNALCKVMETNAQVKEEVTDQLLHIEGLNEQNS